MINLKNLSVAILFISSIGNNALYAMEGKEGERNEEGRTQTVNANTLEGALKDHLQLLVEKELDIKVKKKAQEPWRLH